MNNISITGRVTKDIELSETARGTTLTRFNVAVPSELKDDDGENLCDFFVCIAWRQNAESIAKYFKKGSVIELFGSMNSRKYKDADGKTNTIWELNVKGWNFGQTNKEETKETKSNKSNKENQPELTELDDEETDDLPF